MEIELQLTSDEEDAVKRILAQYGVFVTIQSLLDDWNNFVADVENGYKLTIYDYTNDLSARDILQEIIQNIPSLNDKISKLVNPLDERYNRATHNIKLPLLHDKYENAYEWYYRIPNKLTSELEKSLSSEGFLD